MRADTPLPITLRPRPWRKWAVTAVSVVFCAGGVLMIRDHEPSGWFVTLFFGACALVALFLMGPEGNALTLDADGIECVSPFRTFRIAWDDVREFGVYAVPPMGLTRFVGMNFHPGRAPEGAPAGLRGLNSALSGFEGALPETYGLSAGDLAGLLEHHRRARAGSSASVPPALSAPSAPSAP